jgi:hypothetical protein
VNLFPNKGDPAISSLDGRLKHRNIMKGEAARHERRPVDVAPDHHAQVSFRQHAFRRGSRSTTFALPLHGLDLQHLGIWFGMNCCRL